MSTTTLLADLANTPIFHDPLEMGAWTAMIGLFATLGKMALNKIDRMIALVVRTQEKQVQDQKDVASGMVATHAEQLDRLGKDHRDHTERVSKEHAAQVERMAEAHAAQVETLTGVVIDSKNATTALLVQIDRYTQEMREIRSVMAKVSEVIERCPGWTPPASDRREQRSARHERHEHPQNHAAEDPHD